MTLESIRAACPDAMTFARARYIYSRGRATVLRRLGGMLTGRVMDSTREYRVQVQAEKGLLSIQCRCECGNGRVRQSLCCHGAALLMEGMGRSMEGIGSPRDIGGDTESFLGHFELWAAKESCLRLHAQINWGHPPRLQLRVGVKRMYVIGQIDKFLMDYDEGEEISMGKGLVIDAQSQGFTAAAQPLLEFAREAMEQHALLSDGKDTMRELMLTDGQLCSLLELLKDQPFHLKIQDTVYPVETIIPGLPPLAFSLGAQSEALILRVDENVAMQPLDRRCRYVFSRGNIYAPSPNQAAALVPLLQSGEREYAFYGAQQDQLLSEVLPQLRQVGQVRIEPMLERRMVREPLLPRVTLDIQGGQVTAQVRFAYGEMSIDPFAPLPERQDDSPQLMERDVIMERQILDVLSRHGFRVRSSMAYLEGDDGIYSFLTEGVPVLQGLCEVFSSTALLALRPRRVRPTGKLSVRGGMLEFSLTMEEVPPGDYGLVLEALREKRSFVRVSGGMFLSLREDDGWAELADYVEEAGARVEDGVLRMERSRAAYLDALLQGSNVVVERDENVRQIADALSNPRDEEPPISGMRPYQARGFSWLCALARLQMGGILADDMGLGKTLQVLSLVEWARLQDGTMPTLVVAPTSLVFNWLAEVTKFAPHLKTMAMEGSATHRQEQCAKIGEMDLVVTSYAQLRRDVEFLRDVDFRFVVLDEAQNIKNAATVGAESVKQLQAQARFALSGTPMENHAGELWSLFDFILPGYLGSQMEFMRRFGDGQKQEVLRRRIRPFLMRRLKRDVLSELPEKIEHRITAEMTPAQRDVYYATLLQSRTELTEAIERQGYDRSRMQVLAAITRLRQICCHPSLALEGYEGSSGKLEALMEIMREAVQTGHRILLFSQFTSMLSIIGEELNQAGIEHFYLDGSIPMLTRGELVNRFNAGERSAFLISLRAGGSGLNLHTADMVIHYDPWWNPAVEDQATDRAHRIGQNKAVHVMKLVTRGTIEEKIFALKGKKQQLIDSVITPGEMNPAKLTPDEILSFFEDV